MTQKQTNNPQGHLKVRVLWRTMDTQGPAYKPFKSYLDIYFVGSISDYGIETRVKEAYGLFIDDWSVVNDQTYANTLTGLMGGLNGRIKW